MAVTTFPLHEIEPGSPGGADLAGKLKRCVLLIEDNKDAMRWVQHALKQYGNGKYQLEWKQCLSDGLSRLLDGGIDLILLDLGLGDCSSPFTESWVHKAAPRVPVIVLTGDLSDETDCRTKGMGTYLVKGQVSPLGLVEAIRHALALNTPLKGSSNLAKPL
jgi:DNA-binding response OmpR family regulator